MDDEGPDNKGLDDKSLDIEQVARALRLSIGLLLRRLRQAQTAGELTLPESSALARLDRGGPATSSALAKLEQISAQSMGATLARLEARGLIERRADPDDGRRVVLSATEAGRDALRIRRNERTEQLAQALSGGFTPSEIQQLKDVAPLLERLAHSM
jgi:DNA-binding MarR family transcriptional regulator